MTTSYTQVFGGNTIFPSDVSYLAFTLDANDVYLAWPVESNASTFPYTYDAASIIDVTPDASSRVVYLPPANETSTGQTILFNNVGSYNFSVLTYNGVSVITVAPGTAWQIYLSDNSTEEGVWRSYQMGATVSTAVAGALAGAGLKAITNTLNQALSVFTFNSDYTAGTADRSHILVWNGAAGNLFIDNAINLGNDWFMYIRNQGSANLTVDPTSTELINGATTLSLAPGDSAMIACNGTEFYTVGFGQSATFAFDYTAINVAGSGNYTLSGTQLNRIAYDFTGLLTGNRSIIVPNTVQQYWITNSTTGAFTLTVKTSAGTGIIVAQGAAAILYCNGTNVVQGDTAGISIPLSIAQGGTGATTASGARTNLGATSTGAALFTATSAAAARSTLGGTAIGQALFTTPASIATISTLVGGTGYVDGNYTSVPLTGGTGTGALAYIVVSGGTVISVTLTDGGLGYSVGDLLSANNANLGGSGSGFNVTVSSITAAAARALLEVYSQSETNAVAVAMAIGLG